MTAEHLRHWVVPIENEKMFAERIKELVEDKPEVGQYQPEFLCSKGSAEAQISFARRILSDLEKKS